MSMILIIQFFCRHRYERVKAVQKTGETTRDMWHKADWDKVKEDPSAVHFPRQDWIFMFDAERHAEEVYDEVVRVGPSAAGGLEPKEVDEKNAEGTKEEKLVEAGREVNGHV